VRIKDATAFSIAPGQIVSMRIRFQGIPDIRSRETNVDKGIQVCLRIGAFDFKGRQHEFVTHIFDVTKADEGGTDYSSKMQDKGIVAVRFSQLWNLMH
jgi:hypothetical protein